MKNADYMVYDFETGGFDCEKNPAVQIAIVALDGTSLKEKFRYENLIKPYNDLVIETQALKVNGLKMTEINNGISVKQLFKDIQGLIKQLNPTGNKFNKPIRVGHNVQFDNDFWDYIYRLNDTDPYSKINSTYACTMLDMKKLGLTEKLDLSSCCEYFGIELNNAHKAMPDTLATADLFRALVERMRSGGSSDSGGVAKEGKKKEKSRIKFQF